MSATDGLVRGMDVIDTGAPISVPVGTGTLGRVFNVLGEAIDQKDAPTDVEVSPIHKPAPKYDELETKAVFLITPDSVISPYRSLPSLVLSPTPENTEIPPCCLAMLLINSWIRTVLPTPAPPNRPILPPFR